MPSSLNNQSIYYVLNLHKWQSNDDFIAGRFAYEIPEIFVDFDRIPDTISGPNLVRLMGWLDGICIRHKIYTLPQVLLGNIGATSTGFNWKVLDGVGGAIDFSPGASQLTGYSWNVPDFWQYLRDAISAVSYAVNIVPPHEIGDFVDEEEISDQLITIGSKKWWEKGVYRDSRWFTSENRIEYGVWIPPYWSTPKLSDLGAPEEIHQIAGTDGVYGEIGQYGRPDGIEYRQHFKKPQGYLKGDFFNFNMRKEGSVTTYLRQSIEPGDCGICNTVYKYVTWYRKPEETTADGTYSYYPTDNPNGYATYDYSKPACVGWVPHINTPVLCTNDPDTFTHPDIWKFAGLTIWYAYETQHAGPTCDYNGDYTWYSAAIYPIGPPYSHSPPVTTPYYAYPLGCANIYGELHIRGYSNPQSVSQYYKYAALSASTTSDIDVASIVDFDGGIYNIDSGFYWNTYWWNGYGYYSYSTKNRETQTELDTYPNHPQKRHSFYDGTIYAGGGSVFTGIAFVWRPSDWYTDDYLFDTALLSAEQASRKRQIYRTLYFEGAYPSSTQLAPTMVGGPCGPAWNGSDWQAGIPSVCYKAPWDWNYWYNTGNDTTTDGHEIPDAVASKPFNDALQYGNEKPAGGIFIPYIDGLYPEYISSTSADSYYWQWYYSNYYNSTISIRNIAPYGLITSSTDVVTVVPYGSPTNAGVQQQDYNLANPDNHGWTNYGAYQYNLYGYYNFGFADKTETTNIWKLNPIYETFPRETARVEYFMPDVVKSRANWERVSTLNTYDASVVLDSNYDILSVEDMTRNKLKEHYNSGKYVYAPPDYVPIQSYYKFTTEVKGNYAAFANDESFSYGAGFYNNPQTYMEGGYYVPARKCTSTISVVGEYKQNIQVSATFLGGKTLRQKFGLLPGANGMKYEGSVMFGYGKPLYTGKGGLPSPIKSFARYDPLKYWQGDLHIKYGFVPLNPSGAVYERGLPDTTSATELYTLVSKRVGELLEHGNGIHGTIVNGTVLSGEPTMVDASTGDITLGTITPLNLDLSSIIDTVTSIDSVFFIAHYIDGGAGIPNITFADTPEFHFMSPQDDMDEDTLPYYEGDQVYGGYATVLQGTKAAEPHQINESIPITAFNLNTSKEIRTKYYEFEEVPRVASTLYFGTPSGSYPAFICKSQNLTYPVAGFNSFNSVYKGRYDDIATYDAITYTSGNRVSTSTLQAPQAKVSFPIMVPLFKVGDASAGGNSAGNGSIITNCDQYHQRYPNGVQT